MRVRVRVYVRVRARVCYACVGQMCVGLCLLLSARVHTGARVHNHPPTHTHTHLPLPSLEVQSAGKRHCAAEVRQKKLHE